MAEVTAEQLTDDYLRQLDRDEAADLLMKQGLSRLDADEILDRIHHGGDIQPINDPNS